MLQVQVVAELGRALEVSLAVGAAVVFATIVFLELLAAVE
jgi:hypothetical protein